MVLLSVVVLIISLLVLAKASDLVTDKTILVSRYLGWSTFAAGFILVAVATSLPELAVSVLSTLSGSTGLAAGNVVGSNLANLLLLLPLPAFFLGVRTLKKDLEPAKFLILLTFVLVVFMADGVMGSLEALVFLAFFVAYAALLVQKDVSLGIAPKKKYHLWQAVALLALGIALLLVSAHFLTDSAVEIARFLGVPDSVIGLTIVAIGTSLPELAVVARSIQRREDALALGNLIGSCITNLTLVLGIAALLRPLSFNQVVISNSLFFAFLSVLLLAYWLFMERSLDRRFAALGFGLYALFIITELGFVGAAVGA